MNVQTTISPTLETQSTTVSLDVGGIFSGVAGQEVRTIDSALFFFACLGILLVVYAAAIATSDRGMQSKIVNVVVIIWLLLLCVYAYSNMDANQKSYILHYMCDTTRDYFNSDSSLWWEIIAILSLYVFVYVFSIPMDSENKPFTIALIEYKLILYLVVILIVLFFKYVLKIPIVDICYDYFDEFMDTISGGAWSRGYISNEPARFAWRNKSSTTATATTTTTKIAQKATTDASAASVLTDASKMEVFNIATNLYTYDDAQSVCAAYGARLANYEDVEDAYNNGAEWCNYGWSEGQMAFFPTQKSTWTQLQKDPIHKNDCGRPGVNGGFFGNKDLRFGVNCYGVKPAPTDANLQYFFAQRDQPLQPTPAEIANAAKVQFWKENADQLLVLNGFNRNSWNEY